MQFVLFVWSRILLWYVTQDIQGFFAFRIFGVIYLKVGVRVEPLQSILLIYNAFIYQIYFVTDYEELYRLLECFINYWYPMLRQCVEAGGVRHIEYQNDAADPVVIVLFLFDDSVFFLAGRVPYLYFQLFALHHYIFDPVVDPSGAHYMLWKFSIGIAT